METSTTFHDPSGPHPVMAVGVDHRVRPDDAHAHGRARRLGLLAGLIASWLVLPAFCATAIAEWFTSSVVPNYGVWVVVGAIITIKARFAAFKTRDVSSSPRWWLGGLAVAMVAAGTAVAGDPVVAHWLWLIGAAGVLYGGLGRRWFDRCWPALVVLALLPLPSSPAHGALMSGLRYMTEHVSLLFAQCYLSSNYVRVGHHIVLDVFPFLSDKPDVLVTVAPECSGYRSVYGMLLVSIVFVPLQNLKGWRVLSLIVLALLLAIIGNWLRVCITITLHHIGHHELATEAPHALLGFAILIVSLFLLRNAGERLRSSGSHP